MCTPLTGSQFWEGVVGKEGGDFFQGGLQLFHKSKLKSEIFNDKKLYKTKTLFSATTKNLNWEKEGGVFEGGLGLGWPMIQMAFSLELTHTFQL